MRTTITCSCGDRLHILARYPDLVCLTCGEHRRRPTVDLQAEVELAAESEDETRWADAIAALQAAKRTR